VSLGLSILSWRGAETLESSLESYATENLFSAFTDAQIFLPDPDKAVLNVAKQFAVKVKTLPHNLGIMENMVASAEAMSTDYILMLENDCPLIEPMSEVRRQLTKSLELLKRETVIMSRLRSVREPGQAFSGLTKYRKLNDGTVRSRTIKNLRPDKLRRLTGYALYDGPDSVGWHPEHFEDVGQGFYLVGASVMPWTNQSILVNRRVFLDKIIPLARSFKTRRHANNLPNLEIELNKSPRWRNKGAPHWRNSGWKIACGPGLFTHERIGDRGYN